jgi:hypothetical protein
MRWSKRTAIGGGANPPASARARLSEVKSTHDPMGGSSGGRRSTRVGTLRLREVPERAEEAHLLVAALAHRRRDGGVAATAAQHLDLDLDLAGRRRGEEVRGQRDRVGVRRDRVPHRPGRERHQVAAVRGRAVDDRPAPVDAARVAALRETLHRGVPREPALLHVGSCSVACARR